MSKTDPLVEAFSGGCPIRLITHCCIIIIMLFGRYDIITSKGNSKSKGKSFSYFKARALRYEWVHESLLSIHSFSFFLSFQNCLQLHSSGTVVHETITRIHKYMYAEIAGSI